MFKRFRRRKAVKEPVQGGPYDPDLTWRCDICHEERPDALIGVWKKYIVFKNGVIGQLNIKYCLDKPECLHEAQKRHKDAYGNDLRDRKD